MPSVQFNWVWTLCMQLTSAERYAPWCFSFNLHSAKIVTNLFWYVRTHIVYTCIHFEVNAWYAESAKHESAPDCEGVGLGRDYTTGRFPISAHLINEYYVQLISLHLMTD